ncbi:MAG: cobaltochelatase subunit CobN [Deltaproteobacteria bacterium]|nr:cobaltochelatase subunit CobN [Deltaproteobacteria bacterium]
MTSSVYAENVSILELDSNTYQVNLAISKTGLSENIKIRFFTLEDLNNNQESLQFISDSKIVFVHTMMSELSDYMINNNLTSGKKVYSLSTAGDPEVLGPKGIIFDKEIMEYYNYLTVKNMVNMLRLAVNRHIDSSTTYEPVEIVPENCIHHPDAPGLYENLNDYQNWYSGRKGYDQKKPWVGIMNYNNSLKEGQIESIDALIKKLESEGFNVLPCFGSVQPTFSNFLKPVKGKAPVDMILSFSLKFVSAIDKQVLNALKDLNVPVFNVINPYAETIDEWRKSDVGLSPMEIVWAVDTPELSGSIEPSVILGKKKIKEDNTGRDVYVYETIDDSIDLLIQRLKKLAALQRMPNRDKKVAIIYYNHSQGKQNIAAAYLNVFRSIQEILARLKKEGYTIESEERITEDYIKETILASGRNIGSWAPGELDALLSSGKVDRVSINEYKKWFNELPDDFKKPVIAQWGEPEESKIMTKNGEMIFPMVKLGNIVLLPEPARGWTDDPMKLYHDQTLYPHHQYNAAYLWLSKKFNADAMIHLGTHATYEWLPGKQAGLLPSDPPEIMTGAIPNIYPYIVDDIGEGIAVKRRGRGVIIDHLTPPMREADLYNEYAELHDVYHKYEIAKANNSETAAEYLKKVQELINKTGIANDLEITELDEKGMEAIHLYLHEIDKNSLPYGLHTYGKPYDKEAADETIRLIMDQNPDADKEEVKKNLVTSPVMEMDNLIRGLKGEYIEPGEGNDPLRNFAAIPTGRNFYGFSPARVPSKAAWEIGKRAAIQMIEEKMKKEKKYPEKVGVVLWATETIRNEGVNEATILYLMGIRPVWDKTERVNSMEVILGKELGRPRIDVLVNPSGLYRDMFPERLIYLDEAVQLAMAQTDIENLLSKNSSAIKAALINKGVSEEDAEFRSRFRIFTEKPGSYGNGVEEMVGASGMWDADEDVSNVYLNRTQFAIGQGKWAVPEKDSFTENLRGVDIAVHSRSTNVIGIIDTDDFFMYLGGMSLAVKNIKGTAPDTMVTMHRKKDEIMVENVSKTIGMEMRTRYLNPQWVEGMKKDDYAGARQMADFAENLWGWQVTVRDAVDADKWEQVYEVYVEDKYGLDLKEFFDRASPWAYQSMTARMLEAVRKDYWKPDKKITQKLSVEYAVNVVEKGVACCDHTCNNPMLNQMVVNIISLPGVLSPEMVEKFKLAIEKAANKKMDDQVKERAELLKALDNGPDGKKQDSSKESGKKEDEANRPADKKDSETIEGYKMEDVNSKDESTELTSSGMQWAASLFVLFVLALFFWGSRRKRK